MTQSLEQIIGPISSIRFWIPTFLILVTMLIIIYIIIRLEKKNEYNNNRGEKIK